MLLLGIKRTIWIWREMVRQWGVFADHREDTGSVPSTDIGYLTTIYHPCLASVGTCITLVCIQTNRHARARTYKRNKP